MPAISPQDRTKLEALAALARGGRVAEAESELRDWCGHDGPAAARTLLAALLARRGDTDAAREVLGDVARRSCESLDIAETKLAVSVLTLAGQHDEARRLGALLLRRHGHESSVRAWLDMLDLPGLPKADVTTSSHTHSDDSAEKEAELLGVELWVKPGVVPSLVHAMKQRPATRPISLLRSALLRIVGDFDRRPEMPVLTQALGELAMLVGDESDARRWAHRTLQIDPYNARMALLLGQVADDEAVGPTAQETLRRVSMKFPGYPDVQKAYAQRVELDRLQRERHVA